MSGKQQLWVIAGASLASVIAVWLTRRRLSITDKRKPIPVAPISPWENISAFLQHRAPAHLYKLALQYGGVFRLRLLNSSIYVISDRKICKTLIEGNKLEGKNALDKSTKGVKFFAVMVRGKETIFTKRTDSTGIYEWSLYRKHAAASFAMGSLSAKMPLMSQKVRDFTDVLGHLGERKAPVDVSEVSMSLTMDFICAAMFDYDAGALKYFTGEGDTVGHDLVENFGKVCLELQANVYGGPLRRLKWWDKTKIEGWKASDEIWRIAQEIIGKYRDKHSESYIAVDTSFIGRLVRAPYPTEDDRLADLVTFLFGGHDTTGFTLAWALCELAAHPAAMKRLRAELDEHNPQGKEWAVDMLGNCKYLDQVISETLRLWPAGPLAPVRGTDEEVELSNGMVLPKGASVFMPCYVQQRIGVVDAEEWRPERWDPASPEREFLEANHRPFGAGKRICVGMNLAMLELRVSIATVAQTFDLELHTAPTPKHYVTLKPNGARICFTHRRDRDKPSPSSNSPVEAAAQAFEIDTRVDSSDLSFSPSTLSSALSGLDSLAPTLRSPADSPSVGPFPKKKQPKLFFLGDHRLDLNSPLNGNSPKNANGMASPEIAVAGNVLLGPKNTNFGKK